MSSEKTRIPLPQFNKPNVSKSQAPVVSSTRKAFNPLPANRPNNINKFSKRKSKSFSDLSTFANYKPIDMLRKTKNINTGLIGSDEPPCKLRRSVSASNLVKNSTKVATGAKKNNPTSKSTKISPVPSLSNINQRLKRPAETKPQEDTKPKISKPARIPAYDYKARYNALNEKYTSLQTIYKETKQKLLENEEKQQNYSELLCKYNNSQEKLHKTEEELTCTVSKNKLLTKQLTILEDEMTNIKTQFADLQTQYKQLKKDYKARKDEIFQLKSDLDKATTSVTILEQTKVTLEEAIVKYKADLQNKEEARRALHNTVEDLKGKVRVICRVRPPTFAEQDSLLCNINFIDESTIELKKSKESISHISGKPTDTKMEFSFDKVFGPESSQKEVFEDLAHLVQSALDGYHVCVFAYGQTGSGKTYTMQGTDEESTKGMIPRAVELVFEKTQELKRQDWRYTVRASFLEIYNEAIKDLLNPDSKEPHDIQHNDGKTISVTNLTNLKIRSAEELMQVMRLANRNRATATTNFNEHSSRSHAVTKILIEGVQEDTKIVLSGSLNLVDLAGSESAKTSERMQETKSINKSLSILGTVMLALHNKDSHVPYRNSKLTHLLQNCLGGSSKTLMFVNISPLEDCYSESINSLRFASKVKEVKINAKKNKTYSKQESSTSWTR